MLCVFFLVSAHPGLTDSLDLEILTIPYHWEQEKGGAADKPIKAKPAMTMQS